MHDAIRPRGLFDLPVQRALWQSCSLSLRAPGNGRKLTLRLRLSESDSESHRGTTSRVNELTEVPILELEF